MQSARIWREFPQRYRLEAAKCKGCGKVHFPPRLICDACRSREFDPVRLTDRGTIVTYTVIHVAAPQFASQTPFAVAVVELDDGVRIMTQYVDYEPEELKTGQAVKLEFRKVQQEGVSGVISYGYKAVPA